MATQNRMAFKEAQKLQQVQDRAVERSRMANQPSRGSSTGGSQISADLSSTTLPDADGNTTHAFMFNVDSFNGKTFFIKGKS